MLHGIFKLLSTIVEITEVLQTEDTGGALSDLR